MCVCVCGWVSSERGKKEEEKTILGRVPQPQWLLYLQRACIRTVNGTHVVNLLFTRGGTNTADNTNSLEW